MKRRKGVSPLVAELSLWKILFFAAVLLLAGLSMIWFSDSLEEEGHLQWASLSGQTGALVVGLALLAVIWEWKGKSALLRDVLAHVELKSDLLEMGIQAADDDFQALVDWEALFADASQLDIVFAYGNTWRGSTRKHLQAMALRPNTNIRVYLPNPHDASFVANLAYRFGSTEEKVSNEIESTARHFASLDVSDSSNVSVFYRSGDVVLSYYIFDRSGVMAMYSHSRKRLDPVPTFIFGDGKLMGFLREDLEAIRNDDSTKVAQISGPDA